MWNFWTNARICLLTRKQRNGIIGVENTVTCLWLVWINDNEMITTSTRFSLFEAQLHLIYFINHLDWCRCVFFFRLHNIQLSADYFGILFNISSFVTLSLFTKITKIPVAKFVFVIIIRILLDTYFLGSYFHLKRNSFQESSSFDDQRNAMSGSFNRMRNIVACFH